MTLISERIKTLRKEYSQPVSLQNSADLFMPNQTSTPAILPLATQMPNEQKKEQEETIFGKVAKGIFNFNKQINEQLQKIYPQQKPFTQEEIRFISDKPWQGAKMIAQKQAESSPILHLLNTPQGKKTIETIADKTGNLGIKALARIKAIGDNTYEEAKTKLLEARNDPNNPIFKKFLYQLQDTAPQTILGTLLGLGTTYATKNPVVGRTLSMSYFGALSADEQLRERGKVESLGNIAIDTIGDMVIQKYLEGFFKMPASGVVSTVKRSLGKILKDVGKGGTIGGTIEGVTEVAQTFGKFANDYRNSETSEAKQLIIQKAKNFITSGSMAMEFATAFTTGGVISGGVSTFETNIPPIAFDEPFKVKGLSVEEVEQTEKIKPKDIKKTIEESDTIVRYSPEIEKKVGLPLKGFLFNQWETKPQLMGLIEKGEIADSYLLLKDKTLAEKIFNEYVEKQNRLELNKLKKIGASEEGISKFIKRNTEILKNKAKLTKETPDTEVLLPKEISNKKTQIIGYKKGIGTINAYLKSGDDIITVNSDKLAFVKKHLPNAELRMGADVNAPLQIIDEGKLKGLLMPIKDHIPEDVILASKSTAKEIPTLKKPSQKPSPKKQIESKPDKDVREPIQKTSPLSKDKIEKDISQAKEAQEDITKNNPPTPKTEQAEWEGKFELPKETKFQSLRRSVEDLNIRLKVLNDKIKEAAGEPIKEHLDLWAQKDMLPRKQGDLIRRIRDEKREFVEELVKDNVLVKDLDEYLHANHAIERNAQMNKLRIEKGEEPIDGLSGMTDDKAKEILTKATPETKKHAEKARKIADDILTFEVEHGLGKPKEAQTYRETYKNYVPLFRDIEDDFTGIGRGVDIRGKESKRALGSEKRVVSPLGNIFYRKERAVIRDLKNQIGNTIIKAVKEYSYLKDIFKIEKQQYIPRFNSEGELQFLDPKFKIGDNVVGTKIDGTQYFITVSDTKIARALKNLNLARVPQGMRFLRDMVGIWSAFKTRFRPEFLITNFERDLGEALINLGVEAGSIQAKGLRRGVVKNLFPSQRRIWKYLRGGKDAGVDEFFKLGGDVGHFWVVDTKETEKSVMQIEKEILNVGMEKLKNPARKAIKMVDNIQSMVELGVRFSAYEALIKRGMSKEKAIQSTADLTVNFARQGELSPILKTFYGFINPTIQGSSKVIRSIIDRRGRKRIIEAVLALTLMGFFTRMASILMDDEEDEQIPDWAKNHRLTFAFNGKSYTLWNLPYGYTSFFALGSNIAEITMKKKTYMEATKNVFETTIDSFSPFGTRLSDLIPTLAKPIFEINKNEGWYDNRIYPDFFDKTPPPNFKTYFDKTSDTAVFIAEMLNRATGGSETKSGLIDVHPNSLEYAFDQYFGGPFEFAISSIEAGARGVNGEFDIDKTPFVRQFVREGKPASFSYGIIYDTLERAFKKDISKMEEDRFYRAIEIGVKEKVFDRERANGFTQDFIKAKYQIEGSITNPINKARIKRMDKEDRNKLLSTYSPQTQKEFGFKESTLDRIKRLKKLRELRE